MDGLVSVDVSRFQRDLEQLQTFSERGGYVIRDVVKMAGRQAEVASRRALAKQTGLTARGVQRASKRKVSASAGEWTFVLQYKSPWTGLALTEFAAIQTAEGVEASPWGQRRLFEGSFLTDVKYGSDAKNNTGLHTGVFIREGDDRLPIRQLYGPNIAVEATKGKAAETFEKVSEQTADLELQLQLARLFG